MLEGKGVWCYRRGELERAIQIAPLMGATHILYKVGQGAVYYRGSDQAAARIREAGLVPFAWVFLLLNDPAGAAEVAIRAFREGFQGLVFDTEADLCRNRFREAEELGQRLLNAGLDPEKLYNCSFPNISHHRSLPYDQMNVFCRGGLMPMVYGTYFAPGSTVPVERQAERVIDEWTYGHYEYWTRRWGYAPPLYPVLGPYRDEYGHVKMSAAEFQVWLDRLQAYGPPFVSVFTAAVIADELLPLLRAFRPGEPSATQPTSGIKVRVVSPEVGYLNLRPVPSTELPPLERIPHGTELESLESEEATRTKVGQDGQWLRVRTPDGQRGYVAAWFVRLSPPATCQTLVEVVSPKIGFVNLRPTPSLDLPPKLQIEDGTVVTALEEPEAVEQKVGVPGRWLHVRTPEAVEGYVAAEYVCLAEGPVTHLCVNSKAGLNVRRAPNGDDVLWRVDDGTVLEVKEDPLQVREKLGKDKWIRICTPSQREGYVNGLYVTRQRLPDRRQPVEDSKLPYGESAWIFGIHAAGGTTPADFRFLFQGKNKTGWVLFTEAIGADPNHGGGGNFSSWAYDGYGVIVRLNNGYSGAGTLPVRAKYPDFARACAAYVQRSRGCHIWVIGNEPNNLREHPGGERRPIEHITPEMYAEAFNLVRKRIKEAQPEAIVVPAAVDPYFGLGWPLTGARYRPLDYFRQMLAAIEDLDGICLHTYTHWLDPTLITRPTVFTDPFLQPGTPAEHYYDFQAYRSFIEAIPAKWRDRPVYITETNHWIALDHPPQPHEPISLGWLNRNVGWVRAAYQEIQRWNATPHAQQVHCLLLYRWTGDEWAIKDKDQVLEDFRQALDNDYRWRR